MAREAARRQPPSAPVSSRSAPREAASDPVSSPALRCRTPPSSAPTTWSDRWQSPKASASPQQRSASFRTLPLSRHPEQDSQLAFTRRCKCARRLHHQLIDEQERHAGLDVIEQLLQTRLVDVTARDDADEAGLGWRALHIDL